MILTSRTDKPEAEIGLFDGENKLVYKTWQAHRELAETLHKKINDLLKSQNKDWSDITAVAAYIGSGSFTGLRIGLSVANALAYSYTLPIVGTTGDDWTQKAITLLQNGHGEKQVLPQYGAEAHTTQQKK
jgi:tRNA threonylcarbamoyladenosine biosynthesis protein TsaB